MKKHTIIIAMLISLIYISCSKENIEPEEEVIEGVYNGSVMWDMDSVSNTSTSILYENYNSRVYITASDSNTGNTIQVDLQMFNIDSLTYEMDKYYQMINTWGEFNPIRSSYACSGSESILTVSSIDSTNKVFTGSFYGFTCFPGDTAINIIENGQLIDIKYN